VTAPEPFPVLLTLRVGGPAEGITGVWPPPPGPVGPAGGRAHLRFIFLAPGFLFGLQPFFFFAADFIALAASGGEGAATASEPATTARQSSATGQNRILAPMRMSSSGLRRLTWPDSHAPLTVSSAQTTDGPCRGAAAIPRWL
jgi:hypothetical protein